ncbi:MAG: hypothetical protein IKJ65_06410 [Clostridia bacterium]|nr:hypothetical protein [Clostridia bacterium]
MKKVNGDMVVGEIAEINGVATYYEKGKGVEAGLVEVDGYYYNAKANGVLATGKYYVWKGNGIVSSNNYFFAPDGKMLGVKIVNGEVITGEIAEMNGTLFYYVMGRGQQAGLLHIDGHYYFASTDGKLIVNQRYYVWKPNGLLPEASYNFNELGQLVQ